jgi:hypothetical protein
VQISVGVMLPVAVVAWVKIRAICTASNY